MKTLSYSSLRLGALAVAIPFFLVGCNRSSQAPANNTTLANPDVVASAPNNIGVAASTSYSPTGPASETAPRDPAPQPFAAANPGAPASSTSPALGMVASTATQAVDVAKDGVDANLRDRIISVYGVGTPTAVQTWWVIFYDPAVPSHGRAVKVDNDQITRSYEAKGGVVYPDALTFARSQVTGEGAALAAAQSYAAQHALAYDRVRVLLRVTTNNQEFNWRVQLLDGAESRGFVFVNATNNAFAMYAPPGAVPTRDTSGTGGVAGDMQQAGKDVKNTFLGIGGDLQEFFTGERTVDQ